MNIRMITATFLLIIASIPMVPCDSVEVPFQFAAEINTQIDMPLLNQQLTQQIYVGGQPVQAFTQAELSQVVQDLDFVRTKVAELHGRTPVLTGSPLFDDVLYTPAQAAELAEMYRNPGQRRRKREITRHLSRLWPSKTIYYTTYSNSLTTGIQNLIQQAVAYYNQHTCLTLQYFDISSTPPASHYLMFAGNDTGCYSYIGYLARPMQIINLGPRCNLIGTVEHEIGHALGLYHEQSRKDRDGFVRIIYDNIVTAAVRNFYKCTNCIDSDYPYDFGSMMHYLDTSFAIDRSQPTIEATDPSYQHTMGYRSGPMTFYDLKVINTQYCSVHTPSNGPQRHTNPCTGANPCQNEGYRNPANCGQCMCPEPYNPATNCQTRHPGMKNGAAFACGGDFTGSTTQQTFTSPGWPGWSGWNGATCVYIVTCDPGKRLTYGFSGFHFLSLTSGGRPFTSCILQFVEIRDENLINTGPRYCGTTNPTPGGGWNSTSNKVILILKDVDDYLGSRPGFQFYYTCTSSCTFTNHLDASFVAGGSTSCTGQSCTIQGGTNAFLSSCSPLLMKSTSNPTGTTLTPNPANSNGGKIELSCSTGGVLTASGFTGGAQVTEVTSVQQTQACCSVSDMPGYSNSVTVSLSPQTAIDGRVYGATLGNCYNVDKIVRMRSVTEVCEGVHRLRTVTNNIQVECLGTAGQAGTWANFPGCIPLSGSGGNAVSTIVQQDRVGGAIMPPTPIHNIPSAGECRQRCRDHENGGALGGQFGCVAYAYLDNTAPFLSSTCWIKEVVPTAGPPSFASLNTSVWSGRFEGTIRCNDGSTRPCEKWCDGVGDCPGGDDELGCPEPCDTVHTTGNNACGSTLIGGTAPVSGGKYFQCSPGQCVPCSKVCDKQFWDIVAVQNCPNGMDEAGSTCSSA